jgi:hypothetical protein
MSNNDGIGAGVVGTAVAALALVGIVFGGWEAGWWFKAQDAQREGVVTRSSTNFQQGHMDELSNEIADLSRIGTQIAQAPADQAAALKAQRLAEAQQACSTARDITDSTMSQEASLLDWRTKNCVAGSVAPASPYNN